MIDSEHLTAEQVQKIFGRYPADNEIIGYDIGNDEHFAIIANVYDEETHEYWFGCNEYDCVYDSNQLTDEDIVELV